MMSDRQKIAIVKIDMLDIEDAFFVFGWFGGSYQFFFGSLVGLWNSQFLAKII